MFKCVLHHSIAPFAYGYIKSLCAQYLLQSETDAWIIFNYENSFRHDTGMGNGRTLNGNPLEINDASCLTATSLITSRHTMANRPGHSGKLSLFLGRKLRHTVLHFFSRAETDHFFGWNLDGRSR